MVEMFQTLGSNVPALLCLVIGYALLVLEMCMPGFGVPGMLGIVLLVVGVYTGTTTFTSALILTGILLVLVLAALPVCLRFIGKGRFSRSSLVLNEVSVPTIGSALDLNRYKGQEGVVLTTLRPAGLAEFDGEKLNVVSDGTFIEEGARVRVEHVEGNRVVVAKVEL